MLIKLPEDNISAHLPKDPHEPPHEPHLHVHPLHPPRRNNAQDLSRQRRQGRHRGGGVVGPSELDGPAKATEKMLRWRFHGLW